MQLRPPSLVPLPTGTIRPRGWLERQLRIQASGLGGNLDRVWPDVSDSRWFGGTTEGWERVPYWLDGFVPLAFVLGDDALVARARDRVGYILDHQLVDGWLGPESMVAHGGAEARTRYDLWGQILAVKMLGEYFEATGERPALDAMKLAFESIDRVIDRQPLFDWGQFRWFEALIPLAIVLDDGPSTMLERLATKLHAQGFDWTSFLDEWPYTARTETGRWNFMSHVVNNAMAVKSGALWWRFGGGEADRVQPDRMLELLDRHHGTVTGMFTGDECLAGRDPIQGTELCAVVELAYSLEQLISVFGSAGYADRLEQLMFNNLPTTLSEDMWTHQYDQQVNQVECSIRDDRCWTTNGPGANIYGLAAEYGCCTANFSQGWPKYAKHLWMRTPDGGLAAVSYAPCSLSSDIGYEGQRSRVTIEVETDYPFEDEVGITVRSDRSVRFPLSLRIPEWTRGASITIDGDRVPAHRGEDGFVRIERVWRSATTVRIELPAVVEQVHVDPGSAAYRRGPLVFSLPIEAERREAEPKERNIEDHPGDYELFPASPWSFRLDAVEDAGAETRLSRGPVPETPFSRSAPPLRLRVPATPIPGRPVEHGSCAPVAPAVVDARGDGADEHTGTIELVPYGCTELRMTVFPTRSDR